MHVSMNDAKPAVMPTAAPPPSVHDVVRKLVDYHIVRPTQHVHVYADDPYCMIYGKDGRA